MVYQHILMPSPVLQSGADPLLTGIWAAGLENTNNTRFSLVFKSHKQKENAAAAAAADNGECLLSGYGGYLRERRWRPIEKQGDEERNLESEGPGEIGRQKEMNPGSRWSFVTNQICCSLEITVFIGDLFIVMIFFFCRWSREGECDGSGRKWNLNVKNETKRRKQQNEESWKEAEDDGKMGFSAYRRPDTHFNTLSVHMVLHGPSSSLWVLSLSLALRLVLVFFPFHPSSSICTICESFIRQRGMELSIRIQ